MAVGPQGHGPKRLYGAWALGRGPNGSHRLLRRGTSKLPIRYVSVPSLINSCEVLRSPFVKKNNVPPPADRLTPVGLAACEGQGLNTPEATQGGYYFLAITSPTHIYS